MKRSGLLCLFLLTLSGCAVMPSTEDTVRKLSAERWQALFDEDYKKAWEYLGPGFRKRVSLTAYTLRFLGKTRWKDAEVKQVKCEESGQRCVVSIKAAYHYMGNELFPAYDDTALIDEVWVLIDGHWWHVPRK
jgi:hypothetical protein